MILMNFTRSERTCFWGMGDGPTLRSLVSKRVASCAWIWGKLAVWEELKNTQQTWQKNGEFRQGWFLGFNPVLAFSFAKGGLDAQCCGVEAHPARLAVFWPKVPPGWTFLLPGLPRCFGGFRLPPETIVETSSAVTPEWCVVYHLLLHSPEPPPPWARPPTRDQNPPKASHEPERRRRESASHLKWPGAAR